VRSGMGVVIGSTLGNKVGSMRGKLLVLLSPPAVEGREKLSDCRSIRGSKLEWDFVVVSLLSLDTSSLSKVVEN
jgi:hypothetical protein